MSSKLKLAARRYTTRAQKTLYETLEISQQAKPGEIKSQFYELSKRYHPDKNPGDDAAHEKFLKISEAYTTLSNDVSRREYDRTLDIGRSSSVYGGPRPTTFRSKIRPDDWVLYRNSAGTGAKKSFFDFESHQNQHYQEHQRNLDMMARVNSMMRKKQRDSDGMQTNLVLNVVLLGTGIFLFLQSGMVKLLFMDCDDEKQADEEAKSRECHYKDISFSTSPPRPRIPVQHSPTASILS
ncbi:DnaJ domain-containing protein [Chytridium lagenaria]|nr:DnaJ domain-containing protein [Chytridium lagenaria]